METKSFYGLGAENLEDRDRNKIDDSLRETIQLKQTASRAKTLESRCLLIIINSLFSLLHTDIK